MISKPTKKKKKHVKPFKPLQPHSTKRLQELHEYAIATIGAGNTRESVRLPKNVNLNDWFAVNTIDFFNEISSLYGIMQPSSFCTPSTCPTMTAGPKYEYYWMDGIKYKKPYKCPASEYIELLMTWSQQQLNNKKIFSVEGSYSSNFRQIIKTMLKRLFRIYAHIYHHHIQKYVELDAEAHLNSCFKRFIYFTKEFKLVDERELAPMADTINNMLTKDAHKGYKYKPKYQYDRGAATIGFSVGGSKDINNFRKCIEKNIMPSIDSITYNGIFYDYYFDTSTRKDMDEKKMDNEDDDNMLFYPTYCYGQIKDEYYMSVGLNSNIKQDEFKRKHLNLVIVLDRSGSMGSSFSGEQKNKMMVANDAVIGLLSHLTDKDRFGMIAFDNKVDIIKSMENVKDIDLDGLKNKILKIKARGGTNFEIGYNAAIKLYDGLLTDDIKKEGDDEYENRIIFITDAQPNYPVTGKDSFVSKYAKNYGVTDKDSLLQMVSKYANNKNDSINNYCYTSFIGVGLDFNVNLIKTISKMRGCNYYSVKSSKEFKKRMNDEFEFMVTPLVFDVCLTLQCEGTGFEIDKVYGFDMKKSGEIMKIHTLFPSKRDEETGDVKGGIQLIKLKNNENINDEDINNIELEVIFEDCNGKIFKNTQIIKFKTIQAINDMIEEDMDNMEIGNSFYDNTGIRKGIILSKYVDLMKEWMKYNELQKGKSLIIDQVFKDKLNKFIRYFKHEMIACKDNKLQKEIDIMQKLSDLHVT